jgi:hypothetical protein
MRTRKIIALILVLVICLNTIVGCGNDTATLTNNQNSIIEESRINEEFVTETKLDEQYTDETYITENLVLEDGIYEYSISEDIVCEAYTFEVIVGETSEDQILAMLPDDIEEYDVDWTSVIAKFAVGTTIIVATGIVRHFVKSSYFIVASPINVAKDAIVGGAISATLQAVLKADKNGEYAEQSVKKYAIEGFADGYMWGAIYSVLTTIYKNSKLPKVLISNDETLGRIATDGTLLDDAGNVLGQVYTSKEGIYLLNENLGLELFDSAGNQIVNATKEQIALIASKSLPANAILTIGTETAEQVVRTDTTGIIYQVGDELLPNVTYELDNYIYKTDSLGRIIEASFEQLELKDSDIPRKYIANTLSEIGKGYEKVGIDERGHLIGDRFKGNNSIANIVAMNGDLNKGEYKAMEQLWADSINSGKNVSGTIKLSYSGNSFRPDSFDVLYDIGEGIVEKIFANL